ncbi:MAG: DDE-type integrase/transposase/recombinase, partial [Chloroflexi bacterium]|nr:DDE-type integrase/transposase/recombinase [Chloroflexota bacterium]
MAIEETITKTITCKNCGSDAVVKFGSYKGVPRYFCKSCQRKFKAEGVFHMKVPAEYVSSALSMYYTGMSINEIRSHLKQEHGYYPSKSVVFGWVEKYTDLASKQFKDYHPQVGDVWVADETMLDVDGQHKLWFYDIIDTKTRYLLASRVAISRTTNDAEALMRDAAKRAGKTPKQVITDQNYSYLDGIEKAFGADTEHVQGSPFKVKSSGESTSQIERFHGTLKDRTKVIRSFRDFETLKQFTDGWLIYYNYFKPHESLEGKTPAEEANVEYDVKNWADLARVPVSKQSTSTPLTKTPIAKVSMDKAFRRHRKPRIT